MFDDCITSNLNYASITLGWCFRLDYILKKENVHRKKNTYAEIVQKILSHANGVQSVSNSQDKMYFI